MNLNQNSAWQDKTFWIQKHNDLIASEVLTLCTKMVGRFAFDQECLSLKEKRQNKKRTEKRTVDIVSLFKIRLNKPYSRKEPF